jgi:hypothetical protein
MAHQAVGVGGAKAYHRCATGNAELAVSLLAPELVETATGIAAAIHGGGSGCEDEHLALTGLGQQKN